jgi:hypothetical protein
VISPSFFQTAARSDADSLGSSLRISVTLTNLL